MVSQLNSLPEDDITVIEIIEELEFSRALFELYEGGIVSILVALRRS